MKITMIGRCGAYPEVGQATSGFLLETEEGTLLVDAGSGVLERVQRYVRPEALNAVIISHYHADHVADLGVLQYAALITTQCGLRTRPLEMYLPLDPAAEYERLAFEPWCNRHGIHADQELNVLGMHVRFLRTRHPVPCLAMSFKACGRHICYTADTSWIPELVPFAEGADVLICETSFYKGQDPTKTGHLTSEEAGRLAREAGVGQVIITHLPSFSDLDQLRSEVMAEFAGPVALSETGLTVQL
ncbi:MAG: MBL fold metallo-hydrolase [Alicyclobacillus sp.]|nr:MBL fold metallo-hydrolase [Alicyclobacillus sp.]